MGAGSRFCRVKWPSLHGWSRAGPWRGLEPAAQRAPVSKLTRSHRSAWASPSHGQRVILSPCAPKSPGSEATTGSGTEEGRGCRPHVALAGVEAGVAAGMQDHSQSEHGLALGRPPAGHAGHQVSLSVGSMRAQVASLSGSRRLRRASAASWRRGRCVPAVGPAAPRAPHRLALGLARAFGSFSVGARQLNEARPRHRFGEDGPAAPAARLRPPVPAEPLSSSSEAADGGNSHGASRRRRFSRGPWR